MSTMTAVTAAVFSFRERPYEVSFEVKDDKMVVLVQDETTTDQWRGRFDARHIEELTRKTGNFKQFRVFISMLESAIKKKNDCVSLELLTYSDLEGLRHRKPHSRGQHHSSSPVESPHTPTKRYLILTYSAEFDRIHYPLALPYVGKSDPIQLQEMIRNLKKEVDFYKRQTSKQHKTTSLSKLQRKYELLLQDKEELEAAYEALQEEIEEQVREGHHSSSSSERETRTLKKIIKNLEENMLKEKTRYQRIIVKKTDEIKSLEEELDECRSTERLLSTKVKNLTSEIALLKRNSLSHRRSRSGSDQQRNIPGSSSWTYTTAHRRSSSAEGVTSNRNRSVPTTTNLRSRTPSPKGRGFQRFDPTSYVMNKRKHQEEINKRLSRTRSRSNSTERSKMQSSRLSPVTSSRRINIGVTRSRTSSIGSASSGHSSAECSGDEEIPRGRYPSKLNPKDSYISKKSSKNSTRKQHSLSKRDSSITHVTSSTPVNRIPRTDSHHDSSAMDQSMEIQEIDARLSALQQFMKKSLDNVRNSR